MIDRTMYIVQTKKYLNAFKRSIHLSKMKILSPVQTFKTLRF